MEKNLKRLGIFGVISLLSYGSSAERTNPKAQAGGNPEGGDEQWIKRIGYAARSAAAKHAPWSGSIRCWKIFRCSAPSAGIPA